MSWHIWDMKRQAGLYYSIKWHLLVYNMGRWQDFSFHPTAAEAVTFFFTFSHGRLLLLFWMYKDLNRLLIRFRREKKKKSLLNPFFYVSRALDYRLFDAQWIGDLNPSAVLLLFFFSFCCRWATSICYFNYNIGRREIMCIRTLVVK